MSASIRPTNDIAFRYLFGIESHRPILLSLCNAFLRACGREPATDISLKNPWSPALADDGKETVLDIKARDSLGRWFDVEMQTSSQADYLKRAIHYLARLYADQLSSGDDYRALRPAIGLSILDCRIFPKDSPAFRAWSLRDDAPPHALGCADLQLCFLELTKTGLASPLAQRELDQWAKFLTFEGGETMVMDELYKDNPDIAQAHEYMRAFNEDEMLRDRAEARERFLMDQRVNLDEARKAGLAEGRELGLRQGLEQGLEQGRRLGLDAERRSIAARMLRFGISPEQISAIAGLSPAEIEGLSSIPPTDA